MKPNSVFKQSVQYRVWNDSQCEEVINSTFRILERTGCIIHNEKVRQLMSEAGCNVENNRVRIPPALMKWAIDSAPSILTLYDRYGNSSLKMEPYEVNFGPVIGDTFIVDIETGKKRHALKTDAVNAALVCDALENIAWSSAVVLISDCESQLADILEISLLLPNTTKPIMCWSHSPENLHDIIDMLETVAGGQDKLRVKPMGMCLICPVDPLVHTDNGLSQIIYSAEKAFPILYISGISFGCVGPITLAGSIAVGMADTLVGLLVSQLINKGTPFIASKFSDNLDMKTGALSHSRPELLLANAASADVFRYLCLPFCLNYGGTDAAVFNQQYVFDLAINYYTGNLTGTNLNFALGALEGGNSCSLENIVFGNEVIGYINKLVEGIEVSPYTLAEDLINSVGPGGNFMAEAHTVRHLRDFWEPDLMFSQNYEQWIKSGEKDLHNRLNQRVKEIIAKGPKDPLDKDIIANLDSIVKRAEDRINRGKEKNKFSS